MSDLTRAANEVMSLKILEHNNIKIEGFCICISEEEWLDCPEEVQGAARYLCYEEDYTIV